MIHPFGYFFTFIMDYIPRLSELHEQFCAKTRIQKNLRFKMLFDYKKMKILFSLTLTKLKLWLFFFWGRKEQKMEYKDKYDLLPFDFLFFNMVNQKIPPTQYKLSSDIMQNIFDKSTKY